MSHVTDIMLITMVQDGYNGDGDDKPNFDKVNNWIKENYPGKELVEVDQYCRSGRAFQADLFIAAINYFKIEEFINFIKTVPFDYPECVQLYIKDEHEDKFTEYGVK